jgi:hypothetical protein
MSDESAASGPVPPALRARLEQVRRGLLGIHKALLDAERMEYEDEHGRVESRHEFLRLAIHDPWFAWLRPLLALVVLIDEVLASDEPPPPGTVDDLLAQARRFVTADEHGDAFHRRYHELLQQVPAVIMAHAQAVRLVRQPDGPS